MRRNRLGAVLAVLVLCCDCANKHAQEMGELSAWRSDVKRQIEEKEKQRA